MLSSCLHKTHFEVGLTLDKLHKVEANKTKGQLLLADIKKSIQKDKKETDLIRN